MERKRKIVPPVYLLLTLAASYVALLAVETWWLLGRLRAKRA